jgi:hypothetical protein
MTITNLPRCRFLEEHSIEELTDRAISCVSICANDMLGDGFDSCQNIPSYDSSWDVHSYTPAGLQILDVTEPFTVPLIELEVIH